MGCEGNVHGRDQGRQETAGGAPGASHPPTPTPTSSPKRDVSAHARRPGCAHEQRDIAPQTPASNNGAKQQPHRHATSLATTSNSRGGRGTRAWRATARHAVPNIPQEPAGHGTGESLGMHAGAIDSSVAATEGSQENKRAERITGAGRDRAPRFRTGDNHTLEGMHPEAACLLAVVGGASSHVLGSRFRIISNNSNFPGAGEPFTIRPA